MQEGLAGTDAAVDPDGVVVLLGHARVTAETVLRSDRLLDLRTKKTPCGRSSLAGKALLQVAGSQLTMQEVQKILGLKQPASANTSTF